MKLKVISTVGKILTRPFTKSVSAVIALVVLIVVFIAMVLILSSLAST